MISDARKAYNHKKYMANREHHIAVTRAYHQLHKVERNARRKLYLHKCKIGALIVLGGQCVKCGYVGNIDALQIDHIKPIGGEAKRRKGASSSYNQTAFYRSIIDGLRENLQVLCANCHAIKTVNERS